MRQLFMLLSAALAAVVSAQIKPVRVGDVIRLPLKKENYSKYGNVRSCNAGKCPQDNFYENYGNIQGCYCGSDGISICTGNSITAPDVVRTFDFIDLKAIGKNRFEIVDGPSAAPPANCYGGTSKAQMMEELKFGSGSDCASTSECYDDPARGGFLIDLRETDFEIDSGSYVKSQGWGSKALVETHYYDISQVPFNDEAQSTIPVGSVKVHVPACGGWGGGCYSKIYLRRSYKEVSGYYYTQKDAYKCKPSQEIKWKSECRNAAAALNRPFNERYVELTNSMGGCIWHESGEFVFFDDSRDFPFERNPDRTQICSYKGEKMDPNSGRCRDVQNRPDPIADGVNSIHMGYYDVTGCGVCYDYCRYLGAVCPGGQLECEEGFFTCSLAGSGIQYTKRGTYTGINWPYPKCDFFGQRVNEVSKEVVFLDTYQLHQGDTWYHNMLGFNEVFFIYHQDDTGVDYFEEGKRGETDTPKYMRVEDHAGLVSGERVQSTGNHFPTTITHMQMVDNHYIRTFGEGVVYPTHNIGAYTYAMPHYLRRMLFSMDLGRSPIVFSRQITNRGTYDVSYLDKSPLIYEENTEFHNFQNGQYGSLSTPFRNCLDYTGPKGTGQPVYASHAPNGQVTALRTMTIPESGVYTSTACLHDINFCNDPLAENCTVLENFWSEYMVRLPEFQGNEPYLIHSHKLHLIPFDFKTDEGSGTYNEAFGGLYSTDRTKYREKNYVKLYNNFRWDVAIWEWKFRIKVVSTTKASGEEIGAFTIFNKDPREDKWGCCPSDKGVWRQSIRWQKEVLKTNKWYDIKMFIKSNTHEAGVYLEFENGSNVVFKDLVITRQYPYDWQYNNPDLYKDAPQESAAPTHAPTFALPDTAAQIDFSNPNDSANTPYTLHGGAQILTGPGGIKSLRIDQDGPYAKIPNFSISPSTYPQVTLTIGLYLESKANNNGWVFGHEASGYDRTIILHDSRFGNGLASAVGKTWNPGANMAVPYKKWIHATAVFRQGGLSYVFLDGVRSQNVVTASNNEGLNELWIGRPLHGGHWVDCWIKEVKVFYEALENSEVKRLSDSFHAAVGA